MKVNGIQIYAKKYYYDFPNSYSFFEFGAKILQNLGLEAGKR